MVPFVDFFLNNSILNNYVCCCGGSEENSLIPDGEKLRGKDEVVIKWGLTTHSTWLISVKHGFVQIVGLCVFVYTAAVL